MLFAISRLRPSDNLRATVALLCMLSLSLHFTHGVGQLDALVHVTAAMPFTLMSIPRQSCWFVLSLRAQLASYIFHPAVTISWIPLSVCGLKFTRPWERYLLFFHSTWRLIWSLSLLVRLVHLGDLQISSILARFTLLSVFVSTVYTLQFSYIALILYLNNLPHPGSFSNFIISVINIFTFFAALGNETRGQYGLNVCARLSSNAINICDQLSISALTRWPPIPYRRFHHTLV